MAKHVALDWDARYGWDLIRRDAAEFKDFVVVTSPRAWEIVEPLMPRPRGVVMHQAMGTVSLAKVLAEAPEAELVVACGGGNALDVGKYLAAMQGRPLVMIPTIVSTGSIFQHGYATRHEHEWSWHSPELDLRCILLDFGVIRQAPPRLNCAGMGETIANVAIIAAWRWWSEHRLGGAAWDQGTADGVLAWIREQVEGFVSDLDGNGQPGEKGIRIVAENQRERYILPHQELDLEGNLDHTFCCAFEWVHGRELLHSEAVSLGTLINCFLYDGYFDEAKSMLEKCRTRYLPEDIGCTIDEVRHVLDRITEAGEHMIFSRNWFHVKKMDDARFEGVIGAIEG